MTQTHTLEDKDDLGALKLSETMEVQLCVENLNNPSKELNKWETLMVSIPEREEDNKMVIMNMRGKRHNWTWTIVWCNGSCSSWSRLLIVGCSGVRSIQLGPSAGPRGQEVE